MFSLTAISATLATLWSRATAHQSLSGQRKRLQGLSLYNQRRQGYRQAIAQRIHSTLADIEGNRQMEHNAAGYWGLMIDDDFAEPILHEMPILVPAELIAADRALRPAEWMLN